MSAALEFGLVRHFLSFDSDDTGRIEIIEPTGFDSVEFTFKQDNGRYGRDISFSGGTIEYEFNKIMRVRGLSHEFERIIQYDNDYGYEADIKYILNYNGVDYVIGELDFENRTTDQTKYFRCNVIQESNQVELKRNIEKNLDVTSGKDVFGNDVIPLGDVQVLINSTPIRKVSTWESVNDIGFRASDLSSFNFFNNYSLSLFTGIERSEIDNTLIPFFGFGSDFNAYAAFLEIHNDCKLIESPERLSDVVIDFTNLTYSVSKIEADGISADFTHNIVIRSGIDENSAAIVETIQIPKVATNYNVSSQPFNVPRNHSVWVYFYYDSTDILDYDYQYDSWKYEIKALETTYDTVINAYRLNSLLIHVGQNITTNTGVITPEFNFNGSIKDQVVFSGNQLRNIPDTSFNITFKDLLKGIKEFNADYQINTLSQIYIGTRETFYQDIEIDSFTSFPSAVFEQTYNEQHTINSFGFKYNKYEKGQNDSLENSRGAIHTEVEYSVPNYKVENAKEVTCPFTRDPYNIEKVRRQALAVSEDTTQEDDESKFIVDTKIIENRQRTEVDLLSHNVDNDNNVQLNNDNSFNWSHLGLRVDSIFEILSGQNTGSYRILQIGQSSLYLEPFIATPSNNGIFDTTFRYTIDTAQLELRTSELFTVVDADYLQFPNLNYSIARNIRNFYGSYLRECTRFSTDDNLINTLFINDVDLTTKKANEAAIVERKDIDIDTLNEPVLNTKITTTEVLCDFPRYQRLIQRLQDERGYISILGNNGLTIKTHPKELKYDWARNVLNIVGEDRL